MFALLSIRLVAILRSICVTFVTLSTRISPCGSGLLRVKYFSSSLRTQRSNPEGWHEAGLPRHLTAACNDDGENRRCVLLTAHLCNPQAAVVSPVRRINQIPRAAPPVLGVYFVYFGSLRLLPRQKKGRNISAPPHPFFLAVSLTRRNCRSHPPLRPTAHQRVMHRHNIAPSDRDHRLLANDTATGR